MQIRILLIVIRNIFFCWQALYPWSYIIMAIILYCKCFAAWDHLYKYALIWVKYKDLYSSEILKQKVVWYHLMSLYCNNFMFLYWFLINQQPIKFASFRWVEDEKVADRLIEIWHNIKNLLHIGRSCQNINDHLQRAMQM